MAEWVSLFDGHVDVNGVMSREELALVPAKRGVLALLAEGGRPILLLTAADMRSRLRNRLTAGEQDRQTRSANLRTVTRRVLYKLACSHFETDLYYAELARAIWPDRYASMVAWKGAWFVHARAVDRFTQFASTRDVGRRRGEYIGPFATSRHAKRFAGLLVEAFDLCRDTRILRQAPRGQPCAYAQMGRCPSPCDGSISMATYARMTGEAVAFACGQRDALRGRLRGEMQGAAEALEFERAAALRGRLERLDEFDAAAFAHAAPLHRFNFVIIQPGGSVRRAATFAACGATITCAGAIDYPLKRAQLEALVKRTAALADRAGRWGPFGRLMAGLVARYLFSSERRRGLIVRWDASMTGEQLGGAIDAAAALLKLRAPKKRKRKANGATA